MRGITTARGRAAGISFALLFCSTLLHAQQGFTGTYQGSFNEGYGRGHLVEVILEITTAENGKLAGKFKLVQGQCRGDYSIEGAYQENSLNMLTGDGAMVGCGKQPLALIAEGAKFVGTFGGSSIELSRK